MKLQSEMVEAFFVTFYLFLRIKGKFIYMKIEEWRFVPGYEGLYMVSNWGRIKSLKYGKEKFRKLYKNPDGYLIVDFKKDGIRKTYVIHTLVWDLFGDKPRNGLILQVDHIDNNKENNHIDNLQLLSARENSSKMCLTKSKSSKYTGVSWFKRDSKWKAQIQIKGKQHHIGLFTTQEEASEAYLKAKENLSPEN